MEAGRLGEGRRRSSAWLQVPGRSGAEVAASTAAAERWSRMNTTMPATNQQGEGGYVLLVIWIGGRVNIRWRGGSREENSTGGRVAEEGLSPAI